MSAACHGLWRWVAPRTGATVSGQSLARSKLARSSLKRITLAPHPWRRNLSLAYAELHFELPRGGNHPPGEGPHQPHAQSKGRAGPSKRTLWVTNASDGKICFVGGEPCVHDVKLREHARAHRYASMRPRCT